MCGGTLVYTGVGAGLVFDSAGAGGNRIAVVGSRIIPLLAGTLVHASIGAGLVGERSGAGGNGVAVVGSSVIPLLGGAFIHACVGACLVCDSAGAGGNGIAVVGSSVIPLFGGAARLRNAGPVEGDFTTGTRTSSGCYDLVRATAHRATGPHERRCTSADTSSSVGGRDL